VNNPTTPNYPSIHPLQGRLDVLEGVYAGADTGSPDAYVVSQDPAPDAYEAGMEVAFMSGFENTGPATVNVNSLGAKNIVTGHYTPLNAGQIASGHVVWMVYDGTNFILQNPAFVYDRRGYYEGLVCQNNAGTPNSQVDINANAIVVGGYRFVSPNLTVDIETSGANGLEPGASETVSTWYHHWAIANFSDPASPVIAGLLSEQYPGSGSDPTLPSGYTEKTYLGAVYNDGSGDFISFSQRDDWVVSDDAVVLSNGNDTTYQSSGSGVDLSVAVPPTAKALHGWINTNDTSSGLAIGYIASTAAGLGEVRVQSLPTGTATRTPFFLPVMEEQMIYYHVDESNDRLHISISGWRF